MPYQFISHQLHDFLVANAIAPKPFFAAFNDCATHSLNKKEVKANSLPTVIVANNEPENPNCDAPAPSVAASEAPASNDGGPAPASNAPAPASGVPASDDGGPAPASEAHASNVGAPAHAPVTKKRRRKKDVDSTGSDGTDGHVAAPVDNNNNLLDQLLALKRARDHESSRAEQIKKDREKDTKTQKRCGFYFCGPSNTVSMRVGQGKGDGAGGGMAEGRVGVGAGIVQW